MKHNFFAILLLTCFSSVSLATDQATADKTLLSTDVNSIVTDHPVWAFGDTHGAFSEFIKLIKRVGLVDENLDWSGGKAHLVSTGDVLDRGPNPRKIFDLMMKLENQAREAGGGFHLVLGNHETMILAGDLR